MDLDSMSLRITTACTSETKPRIAELPFGPALLEALVIAFQGCNTSITDVLSGESYSALLEAELQRGSLPGEAHVMVSCISHISTSLKMLSGFESQARELPSADHLVSYEGDGPALDPSAVALIRLLGKELIASARQLCLTPELKELAARWKKADRLGEDGSELVKEAYCLLLAYNAHAAIQEHSEHSDSNSMHPGWIDMLENAATWWVKDQNRQKPELFLPATLSVVGSESPNCQGIALLSAAFAAEAGVPSLRTNLLIDGTKVFTRALQQATKDVFASANAAPWVDFSEEMKELELFMLQETILAHSRVDFHSSCLMRCGTQQFIVDPYASTAYLIKDDTQDPFSAQSEFASFPGANVVMDYLKYHSSFMEACQQDTNRWVEFIRETIIALSDALNGSEEGLTQTAAGLTVAAVMLDSEIRGFTKDDDLAGDNALEMVRQEIIEKHQEGMGCEDICRRTITTAVNMALSLFDTLMDGMAERLSFGPPLSCEYGEVEYCTAITTLQSLLVLLGADYSAIAELARYGCDQSMLYLLAEGEPNRECQEVRNFHDLAFKTLEETFVFLLHPATSQMFAGLRR